MKPSQHPTHSYCTSDGSSVWEFTEITVIEQVLWLCSTAHIEDDIVATVTHLSGPDMTTERNRQTLTVSDAQHWGGTALNNAKGRYKRRQIHHHVVHLMW